MKVKLHSKTAKAPVRSSHGAAGYDLFSDELVVVCFGEIFDVETNISVQIPEGYVGFIKPRSGLAFREGIDTMAGVIDSDYRGTIKLLLTLHEDGNAAVLYEGDKIAQLVILPILIEEIEIVDELDETVRGENGFGSTGSC